MTYIVLRDTLGDGLEVPDFSGQPDVLSRGDLDINVTSLVSELIEEEGLDNDMAYSAVVICEILNTIDGKDVNGYVKELYEKEESESRTERYNLYLKLKEEFEPNV
jgi:hypothetical protein